MKKLQTKIKKNDKKLEKKILKKLGFKEKNFDKLSCKKRYKFNEERQRLVGKKKYDYFEITEPGCCDKSPFKYNNLKEWDYDNYLFQKKHKTMVRENYDQLYMPGDWFRILELNDFGKRGLTYGMLESARSYISTEVYEKLNELIDTIYPSILVRPYGTEMFEPTEDKRFSRMTETEERSCRNEDKRKELVKKLYTFYSDIDDMTVRLLKPYEGYTFRKYSDTPKYDMLDLFIIGGFEAAENISFKTFMKDFVNRQQPVEYLDRIVETIYRKFKKKLLTKGKQRRNRS